MDDSENLINFGQVRLRFGLGKKMLLSLLEEPDFPAPVIRTTRKILFFKKDIDAWANNLKQQATKERK